MGKEKDTMNDYEAQMKDFKPVIPKIYKDRMEKPHPTEKKKKPQKNTKSVARVTMTYEAYAEFRWMQYVIMRDQGQKVSISDIILDWCRKNKKKYSQPLTADDIRESTDAEEKTDSKNLAAEWFDS